MKITFFILAALLFSCKNALDINPAIKLPVFKDFSLAPFQEQDNIDFDLFEDLTDASGLFISCTFDQTVDQKVLAGTNCSAIGAAVTTMGNFQWTPDYTQAGNYEFKIVVEKSGRISQKIFDFTVLNKNAPPVLETLSDLSVSENSAMATVNAADDGNDFDLDSHALTYSCFYDQVIDAAVASVTACDPNLPGVVSFNSVTGIFDWTPDFSSAGNYEILIIADDGFGLDDQEIFEITVNNVNRAPVLTAIADESVNENVAITQINADDSGDDLDIDGEAITYTCNYEITLNTTKDAFVGACTALPGSASFNTATGVFDWTPNYVASGVYEVWIEGSDGSLSDDELIVLTINNVNRAPVLDAIGDQAFNENVAMTQINAADGGDDQDVDLQNLTYTCNYETTVNGSMDAFVGACTALPGTASFNTSTGVFDWTPDYSAADVYEIWINGSDGSLSDDELIVLTINNVNQPPVLDAIADDSVQEANPVSPTIDAADGSDDFDVDSQALTYSCTYDIIIDGAVAAGSACTQANLGGTFSFNTGSGVFDWTPSTSGYENGDASGQYEFKIVGSDGSLSDDELFVITVANNLTPDVSSIVRKTPAGQYTNVTSVVYTVTFSESVVNIDTSDFSLNTTGTASGSIASVSAASGSSVDVTVNTVAGDGDIRLDVGAGSDIDDGALGLSNIPYTGDEVYTIDNTNPTVSGITRNDSDPTNAASVEFNIEFSEAVSTPVVGDFAADFTGPSGSITSVAVVDATNFTVTVNTITGDGTLSIDFIDADNSVTDPAGNDVADYTAGQDYTIDNTDPSVSSIVRADALLVADADANFTVTFSESVSTPVAGDFQLATTSGVGGSISATITGGPAIYNVLVNTITGSGTLELELNDANNSIADTSGNTLSSNTFNTGEIYDVNHVPAIDAIADDSVNENSALSAINANDNTDDLDVDGDTLTYSCTYDIVIDAAVAAGSSCTQANLGGTFSFNTGSGAFAWTPDYDGFANGDGSGQYEFKIIANDGEGQSNSTDDEVFVITVNNTNRAPDLSAESDETVAENVAITAIDADDGGDDNDVDGEAITYTCNYETTINGTIDAFVNTCANLPGAATFTAAGVLNWTPDYSAAGQYEVWINGSDGSLSDDELIVYTITNVNRAPDLTDESNETVAENSAITAIDADDGGDDNDVDGDAITYTCNYETTINGTIDAFVNTCANLPGAATFTAAGVLNWTPDYTAAGQYEVWINGSDGSLSDDELIVYTITNTNRAPDLSAESDETVAENVAITAIDADDGGDDNDVDGDAITYTCNYEQTMNGTIDAFINTCANLPGAATFTAAGVLNWTPDYTAAGQYEIWINGSDGSLSDDELIVYTITNVNRAPDLSAESDETVAENVAITAIDADDGGDDNDVDGEAITYTCNYETTINGTIDAFVNTCANLPGAATFTAAGVLNWTPDYTAAGQYEVWINGSDGSLSDDELIVYTITNVNRAPDLTDESNETVAENSAITAIDADDGGDDNDVDGDAITYTCNYETTINGTIDAFVNTCANLPGAATFTAAGVLNWTPDYTAAGQYEVWINGSDGSLSDDELIVYTITDVSVVVDAYVRPTAGSCASAPDPSLCYTALDYAFDNVVANSTLTGPDLVAQNASIVIHIQEDWSTAPGGIDSRGVVVTGWTTDATHNITVQTEGVARHDATATCSTCYKLDSSFGGKMIDVQASGEFTVFDGLILSGPNVSTSTGAITLNANGARLKNSIIYDPSPPGNNYAFGVTSLAAGDVWVENVLVYGNFPSGIGMYNTGVTTANLHIYNTIVRLDDANASPFWVNGAGTGDFSGSTIEIINSAFFSTSADPILEVLPNAADPVFTGSTNVITGDNTAQTLLGLDDTNSAINVTITDSAPGSYAGNDVVVVTNLTAGSEDFHLINNAYNLALGAGSDIAGLSTDIDTPADSYPAGEYPIGPDFIADSSAPVVQEVYITDTAGSTLKPNGAYGNLDTMSFIIEFSQVIDVSGTPQLTHNASASPINCIKHPGKWNALKCDYTVGATDAAGDLDVASTGALSGGTIEDTSGNSAVLTLPAPGSTYAAGGDQNILISAGLATIDFYLRPNAASCDASPNPSLCYTALGDIPGNIINDTGLVDKDLVTQNANALIHIQGDWSSDGPDTTTAAEFNGWTTDATHRFTIIAEGAARHDGTPTCTTCYKLDPSGSETAIIFGHSSSINDTQYPTVDGFIITGITGTHKFGVFSRANNLTVNNMIFYDLNAAGSTNAGVATSYDIDIYVNNSMFLGASHWGIKLYSLAANDIDLFVDNSIFHLTKAGSDCIIFNDSGSWVNSNIQIRNSVLDCDESINQDSTTGATFTGSTNMTTRDDDNVTVLGLDSTNSAGNVSVIDVAAVPGSYDGNNYVVVQETASGSYDYHLVNHPLNLALGAGINIAGLTTDIDDPADTYPAGEYPLGPDYIADSSGPVVQEVYITETDGTTLKPDASYSSGTTMSFIIEFSQVIDVSGTPQLTHNASATPIDCLIHPLLWNALICDYTVGATDTSADLDYASTAALVFNSGDIADMAGNTATLTLPTPNALYSASDNQAIVLIIGPVLDAISDDSVNEGSALTQIDAGDGGNDLDGGSNAITYQCKYDLVIDAAVSSPTDCSTIAGLTFNTATGVLDWTPDQQAYDFTSTGDGLGEYEFKIIGTSSAGSDDEIFVITVNQVNASPLLDAIADETVDENTAITQVDADDSGNDFDVDGDAITYSCNYEITINGTKDAFVGACTALPGSASFNTGTGVFDWTPDFTASGTYEVWINGTDGSLSDDELIVYTITDVTQIVDVYVRESTCGAGTPVNPPLCYTSLNTAITSFVTDSSLTGPDLVTQNVNVVIHIQDAWGAPDTNKATITGFTTDSTRYITVQTEGSARHDGTANCSNCFKLDPSASGDILHLSSGSDYTVIDGVILTGIVGTSNDGIRIDSDQVTFKNSIVYGTGTLIYNAIHIFGSNHETWIKNVIINGNTDFGIVVGSSGGPVDSDVHAHNVFVDVLSDSFVAYGTFDYSASVFEIINSMFFSGGESFWSNASVSALFTGSLNILTSDDDSQTVFGLDDTNSAINVQLIDIAAFTGSYNGNKYVIVAETNPSTEDYHLVNNAHNLALGAGIDIAGLTSDIDNPADNYPAGLYPIGPDYIADSTGPEVQEVYITDTGGFTLKPNTTYNEGATMSFIIEFSQVIAVTGTPQLTLDNVANTEVDCVIHPGLWNALKCDYTVNPGDQSTDLDFYSTVSLSANGGSITDLASNAADLTLPSPGALYSASDNQAIVISTTPPTVEITSSGDINFANRLAYTVSGNCSDDGTGNVEINIGGVIENVDCSGGTFTANVDVSSLGDSSVTCPTNFVPVPGNKDYLVDDQFCLARYESKDLGGNTLGFVPAGVPWDTMTRAEAITNCQGLGAGYDLMTNSHWQTVARNIEAQGVNWVGGSVGSGNMYEGHGDDVPSALLAITDIMDPYSDTGNSSSSGADQRRTMILSNGYEIWDLASNSWEMVKDSNSTNYGAGDMYFSLVNDTNYPTSGTLDDGVSRKTKAQFGPAGDYSASHSSSPYGNIGRALTGSSAGAVARGGAHDQSNGIFNVGLYNNGSGGFHVFRCVKPVSNGYTVQVSHYVAVDSFTASKLVTAPSEPTLTAPNPATPLADHTPIAITGTCETGSIVSIAGDVVSSPIKRECLGGNYSIEVTFTAGTGAKTVNISQTDIPGNTSTTYNDTYTITP